MTSHITDAVTIFSLSVYFKKVARQLFKVILILGLFFLKYEGDGDGDGGGGGQFDPLPPEKTTLKKAQPLSGLTFHLT